MKLSATITYFALLCSFTQALLITPDARDSSRSRRLDRDFSDLVKRKGGGGSSGGGGGRGGGSSSSSSSGSRSGSSGSSSSAGRTSSSSNLGGATRSGSGAPRAYGSYYGGGAAVPYSAGSRSPRGIAPFFLLGGALFFFPGLWLYGAYAYHYTVPYTFYNATWTNGTMRGRSETKPVLCLCEQYGVCGCDENTDPAYLNGVIGNGSYTALNQTLIRVADVNGTSTIVLNGTLPNGTTAPGGTESSASQTIGKRAAEFAGWWAMVSVVVYSVCFL